MEVTEAIKIVADGALNVLCFIITFIYKGAWAISVTSLLGIVFCEADDRRDYKQARKRLKNNRFNVEYTRERCENIMVSSQNKKAYEMTRLLLKVIAVLFVIHLTTSGELAEFIRKAEYVFTKVIPRKLSKM